MFGLIGDTQLYSFVILVGVLEDINHKYHHCAKVSSVICALHMLQSHIDTYVGALLQLLAHPQGRLYLDTDYIVVGRTNNNYRLTK